MAIPKHLNQVLDQAALTQGRIATLRTTGFSTIGVSLLLSLITQGPSFGSVVWVMALTLSATAVAFLLTWRPQWFRPLAQLVL